jgi:hypothetical protein
MRRDVLGQELEGIAPVIFTPPADIANFEAVKLELTTGTLTREGLREVRQKLRVAASRI